MADNFRTQYNDSGTRVLGYQGSRAGEKFDTDEETKSKKDKAEFDRAMGWSGIGGAAKKPRGPAYEQKFSEWRKQKARSAGQAKALGD